MKNNITTIKYFLTFLLIVGFAFIGRGAPKAYASDQFIEIFPTLNIDGVTLDFTDDMFDGCNSLYGMGGGGISALIGVEAPPATIPTEGYGWSTSIGSCTGDTFSSSTWSISTYSAIHGNYFDVDGTYYIYFANGTTYTNNFSCGGGTYCLTARADIVYYAQFDWDATTSTATPHTAETCVDGIQNQDETGIDIGGVCQTVVINTPVDTTNVRDFQNFSVTYSGLDIPDQNHQVLVQWSDSSSLLTTCNDGVAGSLYTGSFVAGSSYSTCTNSVPRIFIDYNTISFSEGIRSYTGSVPKTHSLVDGKTYYAQAFIVGDDGFYYVASPVISFTVSNGVPVVTGNGTITNSAGSGTVTGTGTHFTSTLHIGDTLTVGGQDCKVLSIASDTELECTPLTSAHTTASYTQNSNFDSSILQETCSTWDFGCYIKNTISWFFGVSDTTLQNFGTLTLRDRFPFSYISDVGTLFGETFDQGADSFSLDIPWGGSTFTIISTTQLEAISFQPLVRTVMGAIAMFFTVMFIYRKIIKVHDPNHKTA